MNINNDKEYYAAMNRYDEIKNAKVGTLLHKEKIDLVNDITEYDNLCNNKLWKITRDEYIAERLRNGLPLCIILNEVDRMSFE